MVTPSATVKQHQAEIRPLPDYRSIIVAVDASDQSNQGAGDAIVLSSMWGSTITGAHVYAAQLHDRRFRQMEGGLPVEYKEEQELEKQRGIHDDLITRGLSVITESYLDEVEQACRNDGVKYQRCALEGKNYRELVKEANSGRYDLIILGSLGLGAVPGSLIGTVCERVARRSDIDIMVIKDSARSITQGPIMVAVDGSDHSFGGLLTALSIAQSWQLPVHVVAAYDPYYHYVAFNRIASVLSEEASKVFRFKEQEKLHEDIIDAGLAKIYRGHLEVAESIARDYGIKIETTLLDGKPCEVIAKQVKKIKPSLLVLGKVGIHADDELDIGGNAENLLRNADCAVLLSQRKHQPRVDVIAEATMSWTVQATERLKQVPSFAGGVARMGVLRYAQEMGHTVVTEKIFDEATKNLCPVQFSEIQATYEANDARGPVQVTPSEIEPKFKPDWSQEADRIAANVTDDSKRSTLKLRAEKKARQEGSATVDPEHIMALMDVQPEAATDSGKCPFRAVSEVESDIGILSWNAAAEQRLERVPSGFVRDMTRTRLENFARKHGEPEITPALMNQKYREWSVGSEKQRITMPWSEKARAKINRIPDFVRGMVIMEIERCATSLSLDKVTLEVISKASGTWKSSGAFHSDVNPDQYQN